MSQTEAPPSIILCTLNAKFIHASLGLRYLLANMARHGSPQLAQRTALLEFTLARQTQDMVHELLQQLGPLRAGPSANHWIWCLHLECDSNHRIGASTQKSKTRAENCFGWA
jgi:hypothetical protein